jgi:hypothetical protein
VEGHHLGWIGGDGVHGCATLNENAGGLRVTEKAGEVESGEAIGGTGVEGGGIESQFPQAVETSQCGGLEDVERFFLVRNEGSEVVLAAIDRVHEEAYSVGIARVGGCGVFSENLPEGTTIACLQQFKKTRGVFHGIRNLL